MTGRLTLVVGHEHKCGLIGLAILVSILQGGYKMQHNCGLFCVVNHPDAVQLTRFGLYALNHRGEESAGLAYLDDQNNLQYVGGEGLVAGAIPHHLPSSSVTLGHTRYSTSGPSNADNTQPVMSGNMALAHNGTLLNMGTSSLSDSHAVLNLLKDYPTDFLQMANIFNDLKGAYCFIVLTPQHVIVVRDPKGFRPLSMGMFENSLVLSSETCGLDVIGANYIRDISPGEMFVTDIAHSDYQVYYFGDSTKLSQCIFEEIYILK